MSLTEKEVRKIARLSRIRLNDNEVLHFQKELSGILDWVETLQEVNTDNVECMSSVSQAKLPWRKDEVNDGNKRDNIIANATDSKYGYFTVPKVVE